MLAPFWGGVAEHRDDPARGRFDAYAARSRELFELVRLADADLAVLPVAWEHVETDRVARAAALRFAEAAASASTPLLVFYVSDSTAPVDLPAATVLRTSLERATARPGERPLPAFSDDLATRADPRELARPPEPRPLVGFCGYAPRRRRFRRPEGGAVRRDVCAALVRDDAVDTKFVFRDAFWAGVVGDGGVDWAAMGVVRSEYIENIVATDYQVCARGGGNYSYRLYETLSASRVPLYVDTGAVLPFEAELDWRALMPIVQADDLAAAPVALRRFHESLDVTGRREARAACRRAWDRYLSPLGFFEQLSRGVLP